MAVRRRARAYLAVAIMVVAGFVLPPSINLNRFRDTLSQSLSRSLGRPVSIENVRLRLLPLPGFSFRQLKIGDDEEFGAEPILQTAEDDGQHSYATLRLSSLWRGRLEIASISLTQASLNIARAQDGHWNLERLVSRASEVPSAPTSKKRAESRARFPYIELTDSRINFKTGVEKKPFSLTQSDFSIWLAAENRWNVRLKAVPLRTDENLSDTGQIRVSGSFDRAARFKDTPFHLQLVWLRPELGAVARIIARHDSGWRGTLEINSEFKGTPANFTGHAVADVDQFRRYDIARQESLRVRVSCDNRFHWPSDRGEQTSLSFQCKMPTEPGSLSAQGEIDSQSGIPHYSVRIFASEVPVASLLRAALHAKSTLPSDLSGDGSVDGDWSIEGSANTPTVWKGAFVATNAEIRSEALGPALVLPKSINVNFESPQAAPVRTSKRKSLPQPQSAVATLGPVMLDVGGDAQLSGSFDTHGYALDLNGTVEIPRLLQVARMLGLRPPPTDATGSADVQLRYAGQWRRFSPPSVSGAAQIHSAQLSLRGFSEPMHVISADLTVDGLLFQARQVVASFPRSRVQFIGSFTGTRDCIQHVVCDVNFSMGAAELSDESLIRLLAPRTSGFTVPFFNSGANSEAKWLLEVPAQGSITAQQVTVGKLALANVNADIEIAAGKLLLRHWTADAFAGVHDGSLAVDFTGAQPTISGVGSLRSAQMQQIATLANRQLGAGDFDVSYKFTSTGRSRGALLAALAGSGTFTWRNGVVPDTRSDATASQLSFVRWEGDFSVDKSGIVLTNAQMRSHNAVRSVNAQLSFGQNQDWNVNLLGESGLTAIGAKAPVTSNNPNPKIAQARQ